MLNVTHRPGRPDRPRREPTRARLAHTVPRSTNPAMGAGFRGTATEIRTRVTPWGSCLQTGGFSLSGRDPGRSHDRPSPAESGLVGTTGARLRAARARHASRRVAETVGAARPAPRDLATARTRAAGRGLHVHPPQLLVSGPSALQLAGGRVGRPDRPVILSGRRLPRGCHSLARGPACGGSRAGPVSLHSEYACRQTIVWRVSRRHHSRPGLGCSRRHANWPPAAHASWRTVALSLERRAEYRPSCRAHSPSPGGLGERARGLRVR